MEMFSKRNINICRFMLRVLLYGTKKDTKHQIHAIFYHSNHKVIFDYLFKSSYMPV